MPKEFKAEQVISGTRGGVWIDGEYVAQATALKATLDNGEIKEVDDCSDEKIIAADTGASVFLTANVKFKMQLKILICLFIFKKEG